MDEFRKEVIRELEKKLGDGYDIFPKDNTKNNGFTAHGIFIHKKDNTIGAVAYLDGYIILYAAGVMTPENIAAELTRQCSGERIPIPRSEINDLEDFDRMQDKLRLRLINHAANSAELEKIPHRKFLDLAIVYECFLGVNDGGGASILIHNSHLDLWKVTEDELHTTAFRNTPELMGCSFLNMKEVLQKLMDSEGEKELLEGLWGVEEADDNRFPMYVLTNRYKIHGNGCILYKNLLKKISEEWGCDICIIPSSVHETILMPMDKVESYGGMSQMICEANRTAVMPDEILSDHPYLFVRETGKITMQEGMDYE